MRMAADTASDRSISGHVREVLILVDPPLSSARLSPGRLSSDADLVSNRMNSKRLRYGSGRERLRRRRGWNERRRQDVLLPRDHDPRDAVRDESADHRAAENRKNYPIAAGLASSRHRSTLRCRHRCPRSFVGCRPREPPPVRYRRRFSRLRNHQPCAQVCQHATNQCARHDREDDPGGSDEHHINVEVAGDSGADSGNFPWARGRVRRRMTMNGLPVPSTDGAGRRVRCHRSGLVFSRAMNLFASRSS